MSKESTATRGHAVVACMLYTAFQVRFQEMSPHPQLEDLEKELRSTSGQSLSRAMELPAPAFRKASGKWYVHIRGRDMEIGPQVSYSSLKLTSKQYGDFLKRQEELRASWGLLRSDEVVVVDPMTDVYTPLRVRGGLPARLTHKAACTLLVALYISRNMDECAFGDFEHWLVRAIPRWGKAKIPIPGNALRYYTEEGCYRCSVGCSVVRIELNGHGTVERGHYLVVPPDDLKKFAVFCYLHQLPIYKCDGDTLVPCT